MSHLARVAAIARVVRSRIEKPTRRPEQDCRSALGFRTPNVRTEHPTDMCSDRARTALLDRAEKASRRTLDASLRHPAGEAAARHGTAGRSSEDHDTTEPRP
jgi:hypothetical protein